MNVFGRIQVTAEEALRQYGWKQAVNHHNRFVLLGRNGPMRMRRSHVDRNWTFFTIGGRSVQPVGTTLLHANAGLPGPWKFVAGPFGAPLLRADFPRILEIDGADDCGDRPLFDRQPSPVEAWVNDLSDFMALGNSQREPAKESAATTAEIATYLEQRGWAAAADGDVTRVMVTLPNACRHILVEDAGRECPRIRAEMLDLAGWPAVCRRAAWELALTANTRLPLVRFSITGTDETEKLQAEVRLGTAPRLPGVWLETAVESLRNAVAQCTRELAALREPELAHLVLAGQSAQQTKGELP